MPFTPFHVGPHATVALLLRKHLDIPAFVLANIAIDLEPLAVMVFKLEYPLHGYCHTFLIGGLVGLLWGCVAVKSSNLLTRLMNFFRLPYFPVAAKTMISAILGVWFHILFDAPIYHDIRPFFPSDSNPLLGLVTLPNMYGFCSVLFVPALVLFIFSIFKSKRHDSK